jgi:DNA repair exonuclease SbcCD nuclease subunit
MLAQVIDSLKIPVIAVVGNHDFESGKTDELAAILAETGVNVLDCKISHPEQNALMHYAPILRP